ncbi:biotin/lipoyl-binding protein, partial [Roseovarius sp.]
MSDVGTRSTASILAELNGRLRGPSLMVWLCAASVWIFILWAAFAWIDEIVRAPGEFISTSRPQIIQNLEGGILAELLVQEGDVVARGDVLARLHDTRFNSEVADLQDQIAGLEVRQLRLEAELAGQFDFVVPEALAERAGEMVAS